MNDELTVHTGTIIRTIEDAERAARAMAASGFFQDTKNVAQAMVKILAGQELGFGPFASMSGVHIVQNKPTLAANLMAAAIKRTSKYNYRVIEHSEDVCEIAFFENGKEVGRSRFTLDDAVKAGVASKENWKKFPRNMLFARALSNGQKWYAPDIFGGATVYVPEELGATVNEDGAVIGEEVQAQSLAFDQEPKPAPAPQPEAKQKPGARPYPAEVLRDKLADSMAAFDGQKVDDAKRNVLAAALGKLLPDDTDRYHASKYLVGTASTKDMPDAAVLALLRWLGNGKIAAVDFGWQPDPFTAQEARNAHYAGLIEQGQLELGVTE